MGTATNTDNKILDFTYYIKKFFPQYRFDTNNKELIKFLGMWAQRDSDFNGMGSEWHIDRGIILVGVPGVGKDMIFRMLRKYLAYLRSPYSYVERIVWEYAEKFKEQGSYNCFNDVRGHNCYYQELARTDENKTELSLTRESVQHFGNKILIGCDLINVRYNEFVNYGYQSHFSTNCNDDQLGRLYGLRAVDRLHEMCNYMILKGDSKRGKVPPQFVMNKNDISAGPPARETSIDEHKENKAMLEEAYKTFLEGGDISKQASLMYYTLRSYNCAVAGDDEIRELMEMASEDYVPPHGSFKTINREEHKTAFQREQARTIAVLKYFTLLKQSGCKTIFGMVDVKVEGMVKDIVQENKSQQ